MDVVLKSLMQTGYLLLNLFAFGYILDFISRDSYNYIYHSLGERGVVLFSIIGTFMHELGHLIMAVLFGHRITGVKLFSLKLRDGQLGYVKHLYNSRSLYQSFGNFFIGIAPLVTGSIGILFFMKILAPNSYLELTNFIKAINASEMGLFETFFGSLLRVLLSLISIKNLTSLRFYLFIFIAMSISSHMRVSQSDIRGSASGLIFLVVFIVIINTVLSPISEDIAMKFFEINMYLTVSFSIATFFSYIFYMFAKLMYRFSIS